MERVCRNCRWFYTNESMRRDDLYLCVNGKSGMLGQFVGDLSDDECDDFERWFLIDDEEEYDNDQTGIADTPKPGQTDPS